MDKLEYLSEFTKIYLENQDNKYNREVACHYFMHKENRTTVTKDDYFLSCFPNPICGFGSRSSGFIYYCHLDQVKELINEADENTKNKLRSLYEFWADENDKERLRRYYPQEIKQLMPNDDYEKCYYTSYPLYRFGGAYLDFQKLLNLGINGLIDEVDFKLKSQKNQFLLAVKKSLENMKELIRLYRDDTAEVNPDISNTLNEILNHEPYTMKEAIQLIWIYVGLSEVRNYGRLDELLSNYIEYNDNDYKNIYEYFKVIQKRNTIFNGRVIIGGIGRKNNKKADRICKIALQVMKDHHFTEPQLTLRCSSDMNDEVFNLAMECIKDGCSYPLLYNDETNIKNVQESMKISYKTATDYVPFGCGEYVINHKSIGSPNGIINLTKILEGILNNGKCLITNNTICKYSIKEIPKTFKELYDVYKKEVTYQIDILAKQEKFEYDYMNRRCGYIFNSILYDKCVERGKSILDGGIDYLGGTLETYGNVNAADSLFAIKKLVYDEKRYTLEEMINFIKNNFIGYDKQRQDCLDVIKYGNDDQEIDGFVNNLNQFVALTAKNKAEKYGLSSYLIVIINNQSNSKLGFRTGASCDGRKAFEPLANALTPQSGAEKNGITAVLNTVSSMNVNNMAGAVYNLKLSKEMAIDHSNEVKILLQTFFEKGGTQIMINVIDQEELKDAMIHPEKYPNLIVRVGGFSARFIDLSPIVQKEIISRMVY